MWVHNSIIILNYKIDSCQSNLWGDNNEKEEKNDLSNKSR